MNKLIHSAVLFSIILMASCQQKPSEKNDTSNENATVYYGGDIITMEGDSAQYVEAIVEKGG
ncbi:hypothetical protein ACSTIF_00225, partial [Vibrio parahaemolyticus]